MTSPDGNWLFIEFININADLPFPLCTPSMHTTVYPINSFRIYNYLFFLSRNENKATKEV